MTKAELINGITVRTGCTKVQAGRFIDAFTETVTAALETGDKVHIASIGNFERVRGKAKTGRNPKTGEPVPIAPANRIKFTASKTLKDAVNGR